MKIRNPVLIRALAYAGTWGLRLWMSTLRYRSLWTGPNLDPTQGKLAHRYIYAFWHEYLLLPTFRYTRSDIWALIGQHADAQILADVCSCLRVRFVRGSASRGGVQAVRKMIRISRKGHLTLTPDGPRGPRRQVKPGLVYLAAQTGLPIVPIGIGFQQPWRLRSWDKFALPRPGSLGTCVVAAPVAVPSKVNDDELEGYRRQVETSLHWATAAAESWAQNGRSKPTLPRPGVSPAR
jgi:lysophospholipid acyltransferase (LPLAT)-like uncharacterized protein